MFPAKHQCFAGKKSVLIQKTDRHREAVPIVIGSNLVIGRRYLSSLVAPS